MVKAIDKKLLRDLSQLRGQVFTICLVVASGIAVFISMQTTYRSLHQSKNNYYESYRFPDVFASARRAPNHVAERLAAIDGVAVVYTRAIEGIRVPLKDQDRAMSGQIISIPDHGRPPLNDVYLKQGRMPDAQRPDEALLLEAFAETHKIVPGDRLSIVLNGTLREVSITGLAMSPEYVFALGGDVLSYSPGSFAVLWMRRTTIAPSFDMEGAFNDVLIRLQPKASSAKVIERIDHILAPYGGFGAFGRDKHVSDHFVTQELIGLQVQATMVPFVFLAVAAFLVNVVLGRLVQLQRASIATLKALGYSNWTVGFHFLKLVSVIVLLGSAIGIAGGSWMGGALTKAYEPYFRFPLFEQQLETDIVLSAVLISLGAAVAGAFLSVRQIISMPPAEAMRPPAPPNYRSTWVDRLTRDMLGALPKMIFRELRRRPLRVLVSVLGISMAVAILVIGRFAADSVEHLMELHFGRAMKEDMTVALREPRPARVQRTLLQLPGVTHAEGLRMVPIKIQAGAFSWDTSISGLSENGRLRSVLNRDGKAVALPLAGMLLTDVLAEKLKIEPGQRVDITLLEGERRVLSVLVAGTVSDMMGMQAYMRFDALRELLGEPPTVSMILLSVDRDSLDRAQRRLFEMPFVGSVLRPSDARKNFERQQGGSMLAMTIVLTFFASVIAIGIVYNNARVSLSMRSRDLASMRVLGFTRAEISTVLLGELAVQVVLALPVGMWLGSLATHALLSTDPENFRMPAMISGRTYLFSAVITLASALISGLLVRRKLDRLDLIGVLKTRE